MTKSWTDVWTFRIELYHFLASCLLEWIDEKDQDVLTPTFWRDFPIVAANSQLEAGLDQLIACTSELEKLNTNEALEQVSVDFTELFIGAARPKAPPIASYYFSNKRRIFDQKTVEMKQLFNEHGLESTMKDKFPEDHLGLQLLFIAVKTEQLFALVSEHQRSVIEEQMAFIEDHVLSWIPGIRNDAQKYGKTGFYGGLMELIWGVLLWDIDLLKEVVDRNEYVPSST